MSMKIRKSVKKYNSGISKVISSNDALQIIFKKLSRKQLFELQALIDIYIGICYLALGKLDKAFEYFINNIKRYPTVKFVFMRSHHCFDADLFKNARKIYSKLQSTLVTTEVLCSPCSFVFK